MGQGRGDVNMKGLWVMVRTYKVKRYQRSIYGESSTTLVSRIGQRGRPRLTKLESTPNCMRGSV